MESIDDLRKFSGKANVKLRKKEGTWQESRPKKPSAVRLRRLFLVSKRKIISNSMMNV